MENGKITIAGIGSGSYEDMTVAVIDALKEADVIVGYHYYFEFISGFIKPDALCIDSGMKQERQRAEEAFLYAKDNKLVLVISSGDSGIYGMAPLLYEMKEEMKSDIVIEVLPGISAFQTAGALLGAPFGHDFCVISLSDLMTPWQTIEKRIIGASQADFVTAVYNPRSKGRYWQLDRLKELFLKDRSMDTPVGIVRQAGRPEQEIMVTNLGLLDCSKVDMFTIVIIGNSQSFFSAEGDFITPRGYYSEKGITGVGIGQEIMMRSFRIILGELGNRDIALGHQWALLHAIHTTADFDMEHILYTDTNAVEVLYAHCASGRIKTIVTDVTMVAAGIRKGALKRLGIGVVCCLSDPNAEALAKAENITRSQAGIRLAAENYPDALFVFGNAPTALMELCLLIRKGIAHPSGIIAAPVGFVNVRESKHMVKPFKAIPKIIVEGRKGGSNLAATLTNAILCFDDAELLKPGRDV